MNNGVYTCCFATTQQAYEEALTPLFAILDWLEQLLSRCLNLRGYQLTVEDWRLFTTLHRLDQGYVGHFKCNLWRIVDYPNLQDYVRDLYQIPGVAAAVNIDHMKRHYYRSHYRNNPTGIGPLDPQLDLERPHRRAALGGPAQAEPVAIGT